MPTTVLHADLDAFYASVEQRDNLALRGRPVIVGPGVVLAASYEAKKYGVRTAMSSRAAKRLCPEAVVVEPRMAAYAAASRAVFEVFTATTPLVEALSIDEAFLDVGGMSRLAGSVGDIAARLKRDVRDGVGLPISVGAARTKFLAKVASGVAKPDGLLIVPLEDELNFLHPLPVERLWGVGRVTARKLRGMGILTVGQVARVSEPSLVSILGQAAGRHLHALARNQDSRPVEGGRRRHSIGAQRALGRRRRTEDEVLAIVIALVDHVTRRLREARRVCRTVVLRLRFDDFSRASRSHTLPDATANTANILSAARTLVTAAMPMIGDRGLTLVGVGLENLDDARVAQLALPFDQRGSAALDVALDDVRRRFGAGAITRGALLRQ
ncbi:MAG TPA: DNA polymerase IV [Candidatus Sulfotelmatobacter sp.]|nr:DNA polymerase IV [Candidatus Sulfotelmatobacter sp.]